MQRFTGIPGVIPVKGRLNPVIGQFLQRFTGLSQPEEAQSVDAMSGATVSSDAVRGAVSQALAHARDVLGAQEVE